MRGRLAAWRAKKRDQHEPRHVKSGEQSGESPERENRQAAFVSEGQNRVLAEEAAEAWETDERERADEKGEKGDRQPLCESAHAPDVLLVVNHEKNRAGAEEEQRLESRVGEEMEHRGLAGSEPDRHHHVAELRERGIGVRRQL